MHSFTDAYSVSGGVCTIIEFTDEQGTIDLRTERDQTRLIRHADGSLSPEGLLTGIRALTGEESAARSQGGSTFQTTATSEGEMTAAESRSSSRPTRHLACATMRRAMRWSFRDSVCAGFWTSPEQWRTA